MSIDYPHKSPQLLHAICLGPEVVKVRASRSAGRVIALLRNAIYLESNAGHIISIVDGEIDGPLTLRVTNITPLLAALKASSSETFQTTDDALHLEGAPRIAWSRAPKWTPRPPEKVAPASLRLTALDALAGAIAGAGQLKGFGPLAAHLVGAWSAKPLQASHHLDATASRALAELNRLLEATSLGNHNEMIDALLPLIGLGPGLTPSGDDLIAGIAASLVWQVRVGCIPAELARQVVQAVRGATPASTNRISARLLWYACEGVLYAPAMKLGEALLSGDTDAMLRSAKHLFSIGHTTGLDLAVGLLTGILLGLGREIMMHDDTRSVVT
jgi:hypothetical protein